MVIYCLITQQLITDTLKFQILPLLPQARSALLKSFKSNNLIPMSRQFADKVDKTVHLEEIGNAGVITLNRPKALNAINRDMVQ